MHSATSTLSHRPQVVNPLLPYRRWRAYADRMRSYSATITRIDDGWSISANTAAGQVVTAHTRRLATADTAIAELIADIDKTRPNEIAVDSQVLINGVDATGEAAYVNELKQLAQELPIASNRVVRRTAQRWRDAGVPLRDIGALLGVSHQRAAVLCEPIDTSQLLVTDAAQQILDRIGNNNSPDRRRSTVGSTSLTNHKARKR